MRKFICFIMLLMLIPALLFGQGDTEPFHFTWKLLIPIVLGVYDVLARLIPTVKDYSWLSWIIKFLNFLNEFFNRKKK